MKNGEARLLLGFPPNSRPTPSQVKAAYKRKVWDFHPDRFPADKRSYAESRFKMISEAYSCLLPGNCLPSFLVLAASS
uniref:J domain-containing protein n=1 Tax=Chenopodium quinoa TaxID=63459 RepID=A0A803LEU3_CHEQI